MNLSFANIIHILIIWQSLLFTVVLATPAYNKNKSNIFLSLLLLTLAIHFSYNFLYSNGLFLNLLPRYSCVYGCLYGPMFYLYIQFHLEKNAKMTPKRWLHFIPFLMVLVTTTLEFKICKWAEFFIFPSMLIYAILSFRALALYSKTIPHVTSKSVNSETKWLKTLSIFMLVIVVLDVFSAQFHIIDLFNVKINTEIFVQIGILLFVSLINYQGLKNPRPFQQISASDIALSKASESKAPITKTDFEAMQELASRLDQCMESSKLYLDPDLNINGLAQSMGVTEKTLSQTINTILGANFSDYINTLRIEFVKQKLVQDKDKAMSIKEAMYEAGFNSRSVFNTAFKKKTGLTPSEYLKQYQ